jgi:hypothetical protein
LSDGTRSAYRTTGFAGFPTAQVLAVKFMVMNTSKGSGRGEVIHEALLIALARERARGRFGHHVAAAVGVHPSELSRWLNGHKVPTVERAQLLAIALGEPLDRLFPEYAVGSQIRAHAAKDADMRRRATRRVP